MTPSKLTLDFHSGLQVLLALIDGKDPPSLIAIAGRSCSGKTYLARKLMIERPSHVCVVNIDLYFKDIGDPAMPWDPELGFLFDVPEAYRREVLRSDINTLMSGQNIITPAYDLRTNSILPCTIQGEQVASKQTVIADGLFAIMFLLERFSNAVGVFVETPEDICLERRIMRDTALLGVSEAAVRGHFFEKILPFNKQWVDPQKQKAQFVINGF